MSRTVKVKTREMGDLHLHIIEEKAGVWEEEWRPLQGTVFAESFTRLPHQVFNEGLKGWTKPLVDSLSVPPEGALRRFLPSSGFASAASSVLSTKPISVSLKPRRCRGALSPMV